MGLKGMWRCRIEMRNRIEKEGKLTGVVDCMKRWGDLKASRRRKSVFINWASCYSLKAKRYEWLPSRRQET